MNLCSSKCHTEHYYLNFKLSDDASIDCSQTISCDEGTRHKAQTMPTKSIKSANENAYSKNIKRKIKSPRFSLNLIWKTHRRV